jgi:hypothetical protein
MIIKKIDDNQVFCIKLVKNENESNYDYLQYK